MGTRGAMGVRVDGVDKVTYNHFDSYPEGLGEDMVQAIRSRPLYWFREKSRELSLIDPSVRAPTSKEVEALEKYAETGVSTGNLYDWYVLLRNTQGDLIETLDCGYMIDDLPFLEDSLFCEWAYILNLDEERFEVYRGFQEKPHQKGRFALNQANETGYYPVALVWDFDANNIPEDWIDWVLEDEGEEDD